RLQVILRETVPGIRLESVSDALQTLLRSMSSGDLQAAAFATRTIELIRSGIPAGFDVESLRTALTQFATELTHPGFRLRGSYGLGPLPLGSFSATAPTTVPLARP